MILVRTPLRIPLGGGGTDLPSYYEKFEGTLITAAINKYVYILLSDDESEMEKDLFRFQSGYKLKPYLLDEKYVEAVKYFLNITTQLYVYTASDLPYGTGLGSSGAMLTGLIYAMRHYLGLAEDKKRIAEDAFYVEREILHRSVGKQDQYASAFGGLLCMDINRHGFVETGNLNLLTSSVKNLEKRLVMFYTNIKRSAEPILAEQQMKVAENNPEAIDAMHKIKEIGRKIVDVILADDYDTLGNLLNEHWIAKKSILSDMTTPDIDNYYDLAIRNGAIGGKLMGAGGGGYLLFCVQSGLRDILVEHLSQHELQMTPFNFDLGGVKLLEQ